MTDREGDPMLDPSEILHHWGDVISVILDSGVLDSQTSTIVDCTDANDPVILREGKGDISLIY